MREGIVPGARSEIFTVLNEKRKHDEIIGGAHLLEAMLFCVLKHPENPNVEASLRGGVKITRLDPRTPDDALRFFKELGNKFNRIGAPTTLNEVYDDVEEIQVNWKSHRGGREGEDESKLADHNDDGDQVAEEQQGQKGYQTEYKSWLNEHYPGRFKSFLAYLKCFAFKQKMKTNGMWKDIIAYVMSLSSLPYYHYSYYHHSCCYSYYRYCSSYYYRFLEGLRRVLRRALLFHGHPY